MSEVIRLVRLSLILRLAAAFVAVFAAAIVAGERRLPFHVLSLLPSLALLGLTIMAPRRGWTSRRFTRGLLVAVIVALTIETVIAPFFFVRLSSVEAMSTEMSRRTWLLFRVISEFDPIPSFRVFLGIPLLFTLIPALLGAWVDGKRGAWRWAVFTILISLGGIIAIFLPEIFDPSRLLLTPLRPIGIGETMAQAAVIVLTCYFVGSLADQQRAEQAQLEAAHRRLAEQAHVREQLAASRERVRLARDLHDTLAHTLAGLAIQINAVGALIKGDQPEVRRELAYAREMVEEGLVNTRQAIGDLRANAAAELGLAEALRRQAEMASQRSGIQATFEECGEALELSEETADTLVRIAQEALVNVERHARAQHAAVRLRWEPGDPPAAVLSIQDDGIGFDAADLADQRFGLQGMRERAELIGGHLRLDSVAGEGTQVTVTVPVPGGQST